MRFSYYVARIARAGVKNSDVKTLGQPQIATTGVVTDGVLPSDANVGREVVEEEAATKILVFLVRVQCGKSHL